MTDETSQSAYPGAGLLEFLKREARTPLRPFLFVATVAGLSNALILATVNIAAEHAEQSETRPLYAVAFVAVMLIYMRAQGWILTRAAQEVETIIHRVRMRVMEEVKQCELLEIEDIGRSTIYSAVARHTQTLSQSASSLAISAQMAILVIFTALYIAYISPLSLVAVAISLVVILLIYFRKSFSVRNDLYSSLEMENSVQMAIEDLLDGLREAKLSRKKTESIRQRIEEVSQSSASTRERIQVLMAKNFVFSQTSFYILIGIVVFVVPQFTQSYSEVVQKSTTSILFLIGPISGVVGAVPILENVSAATNAITALEKRLKGLNGVVRDVDPDVPAPKIGAVEPAFSTIEIKSGEFSFPDRDGQREAAFSIGPIDLKISRKDLIFITGGNGSGKSTLLYLLLGLYPLQKGQLLLDGKNVDASNLQIYRELFSAVFSDFHLSRHLDGVESEHMEEAEYWLEQLEISDKVSISDGQFSTTDLSTGQRKRLALVNAILERSPILVLDEWAADQDPVFRGKFYRNIVPALTKRGHTIVAVTHDSRFFDVSTRQVHMEYGVIADFDPETFHD